MSNPAIAQLSSRELQMELLRRAIARGDELICGLELHLQIAREKQNGRIRELAIQETELRLKGATR